ncbi:MAG: HlyD family efflux transporter periplasmic adaptor subunit [Deltaproteobacteria bacterium]|nr:HlyD family efflux transporter periplasmic adaptor subunit [Deltaproteobacteria bacterium]
MSNQSGYERPVEKRATSMAGWLAAILSILILGTGAAIAVIFIKTKPEAKREPEAAVAPLVEVVTVKVGTHPVTMQVHGQVMPAEQVVVMPEVGGRVMWQSEDLVPGGLVKKGQPLVRIDPRDYALALKQQQAQLANQQLMLQVEKGRRRVAEQEWEIYQQERKQAGLGSPTGTDPDDPDAGAPLALRQPHVKTAEVAVGAARSNIARAKLQLSKTGLIAPFNAFVQRENVDVGQLVGPASQLAVLVGTDAFWVQVSLPMDKLDYVAMPQGKEKGSPAKVWVETGRGRIEREGYVVRLLGDLDPVGRMARLLVEIDDPFQLREQGDGQEEPAAELSGAAEGQAVKSKLPLLLGSFVRVVIQGVELEQVAEIPRVALQPSNEVFLLSDKGTLEIKKVQVVWGAEDTILVSGPLKTGQRLIVSPLQAPVVDMLLRVVGDGAKPAASGAPR